MTKQLIFMMALIGTLSACKCKEKIAKTQDGTEVAQQADPEAQPKTMPKGRLTRVTYSYRGMRMEPFSNFDLQRTAEGNRFSFNRYNDEVTYEVSDTLFDAARRIIEEERIYEYDTSYAFQTEYRILDGYSWSFSARFEGNETIDSHGKNASPKGDGLHKINLLFINAATRLVEAERNQ